MESPQNLKKRLKSVSNINKITKAMELVAATKMRRAQEIALASRPYAFTALELLANLSLLEKDLPELLKQRKKISTVLFVLISSDKGLAGAFNSSVFKKFEAHMGKDREKYKNEKKVFIAIGKKSFDYLSKKDENIVNKFLQVGDYITPDQVHFLTDYIIQGYIDKKWGRVVVISTHFKSALKQEPHVRKFLPIDFNNIAEAVREIIPERGKFADLIKERNIDFTLKKNNVKDYLIEPSAGKVLEKLAKHLCFMEMYHLILEANASEHSARRLAMKTASDNASDLAVSLNLQYNKSRQSFITREISEITAGVEALS